MFHGNNSKESTGSHRYCNKIKEIFAENTEKISEFIRPQHACSHGTRKGAAIEATSGTTLPASMAAVANRGEWSLSMVFDIYLGFSEPGDQYLGHILAGLQPNQ